MYMTKREKELSRASEAGRLDFFRNAPMNANYENDEGLKQAWENGYRIAKEQEIAWNKYENSLWK